MAESGDNKKVDSPSDNLKAESKTASEKILNEVKTEEKTDRPADKSGNGKDKTPPVSKTADSLFGKIDLQKDQAKPEGAKPEKHPDDPATAKRKADAAADAINEACNGGITGAGTDHKAIIKTLEDKTESERKLIKESFLTKTGHSIEDEFADEMDKSSPEYIACMAALNRKDGHTNDAGRIEAALQERSQLVMGRSNRAIEQDVIDTVSTMNSKQIAALKEDFMSNPENKAKYPGGLEQAVQDSKLSDETKKAFSIFMKGSDERKPDDVKQLVDIAVSAGNLELLEQSMRGTSQAVRDQVAKDPNLNDKLERAFGTLITDDYSGEMHYASTPDLQQAKSYLEEGHLKLSESIKGNTSIFGDNEEAIEASIKKMPDDERQSYMRGRIMAETGKAPENYTDKDKKTFDEINAAMKAAGNENEVGRWQSMLESPKGSLAETLSRHRGSIYDSGTDTVTKDLENMSQQEWKRLHDDPHYFEQVRKTLGTFADGAERDEKGNFANTEMGKLSKMLHDMRDAGSYEEAMHSGRRPLEERIQAKVGYANTDEDGIYSELEKLSPQEQKALRDNPDQAQKLRDQLTGALDKGAELDTALGMVDNIIAGKPAKGLLEKINEQGAKTNTQEDQVIRDFRQALKDDPKLFDRIQNDSQYREKLTTALHNALDPSEFDTYAKPLLEKGTLPIEKQMELNKGVLDDNELNSVKDILFATPAEKERIEKDPEYKKQVMGFLSADEQKVALNALKQGKLQPEDLVEINMLGAGTSEEEVKQALKDLTPEQKEQAADNYYTKYGKERGLDMASAMRGEMGGKDRRDVEQIMERQASSGREEFNRRRDEYYDMRGVGETWVDNAWDGTADDVRASHNEFAARLSNATKNGGDIPPEELKRLSENVVDGLEQLSKSQGAVADAASDAVITIGSLAAAKFTGGASLSLLAYTSMGAAFMRVGAHSALDSRFEAMSAEGATQFVAGAADGFFSLAGGAEVSKMMSLGKECAEQSAEMATKQLLKEGGELLASTSEKGLKDALSKGTTGLVSEALANGVSEVEDKAIKELAESLVKRELAGQVREDAVKGIQTVIKTSLEEAITKETSNTMRQTMREIALNAAGGNLGASMSAIPRAMLDYDPEHPEQFFYAVGASAAIGTIAGGGFTALAKGAGEVIQAFRGAAKEEVGTTARELSEAASHKGDAVPIHGEGEPHVRAGETPRASEADAPPRLRDQAVERERAIADMADESSGKAKSSEVFVPERDWRKMTDEERKAIEDSLGKRVSPLYWTPTQEKFADQALGAMKNWDTSLIDAVHQMKLAESDFVVAKRGMDRVLKAVPEAASLSPEARQKLLNQPELLKLFDGYKEARTAYYASIPEGGLDPILSKRAADLQKVANDFMDSKGLPRVEIQNGGLNLKANGQYSDGVIRINGEKLADTGNSAKLLATLWHELTHAEQDATIIHGLADELKIRGLAGTKPEKLAELQTLYKERTGMELTDKVRDRVLDLRKPELLDLDGPGKQSGHFLNEADTTRSQKMADAFKSNKPMGEVSRDAGNSFVVLERDIKGALKTPNGEYSLIEKARTDENFARHLFGNPGSRDAVVPPAEWQPLLKKQPHQWLPEDKLKVKVLVEQRMDALNSLRKGEYVEYMHGLHEKEALLVGEKMRDSALSKGATETTPKSVADLRKERAQRQFNDEIENFNKSIETPDNPNSRPGSDIGDGPVRVADNIPRGPQDAPKGLQRYQVTISDGSSPINISNENIIILGRGTDADPAVKEQLKGITTISRNHAQIELTDKGPVISNMKEGLKTFVNDDIISGPVVLKPGDRIRLSNGPEMTFGERPPVIPRPAPPHEVGPPKFTPQERLRIKGSSGEQGEAIVQMADPRTKYADNVIVRRPGNELNAVLEVDPNSLQNPVIVGTIDGKATYVDQQGNFYQRQMVDGKLKTFRTTELESVPKSNLERDVPNPLSDKVRARPTEVRPAPPPDVVPPAPPRAGTPKFEANEPVKIRGRQDTDAMVVIKGADPSDANNVIVRVPGEKNQHLLVQLKDLDKPVEIDIGLAGKTYRDAKGNIYNEFEGIMIRDHNLQSVAKDALEARPPEIGRVKISDKAQRIDRKIIEQAVKDADPPRITDAVPKAPGRPGGDALSKIVKQDINPAYEGVGIVINGKRLDVDPKQGLELGRGILNSQDNQISKRHGNLKWDPEAQSFFIEDFSKNGTNVRRPGETNFTVYKDSKVYIGPHDEIKVGQSVIKLDAPNFPQSKYTGAMRTTDVQAFFDGQPLSIKNGEIKLGLNHQSFGNQKNDVLNKLVSREHANLKFDEAKGQWILTDTTKAHSYPRADMTVVAQVGEPNGTYIHHQGGGVTVLRGDEPGNNSIALRKGDRVTLGSKDGPELKMVFGEGKELGDGRIEFKRPNLDTVVRRPDGSQEITSFVGTKRVEDMNGKILATMDRNGAVTHFGWNDKNELVKVTLPDGSSLSKDGDAWVRSHADGRKEQWWRGGLDVDRADGSLRYSDGGKPPRITVERLDGSREIIHPSGRVEYKDVQLNNEVSYMNELSRKSELFPNQKEQVRFKELMNTFENRALKEGISKEQRALTFHHVRRLLEAGDNAMVPANLRLDLAEQVLNQAGNPRLISQGANNTCNVTTLERRIYTRNPEEAARMVADIATTGKYVSADGTIVDVSRVPGALAPDNEARLLQTQQFSPAGTDLAIDGKRTYASQVFETAAVNIKYARGRANPNEIILYQRGGLPGQEKEQLVRYTRDASNRLEAKVTGDAPGIPVEELAGIHNQIIGKEDVNFVIGGPESYSTPGLHKYKDNYGGKYRVPQNVDEFRNLLKSVDSKDWPVVLMVHTGHPFFGQGGEGGAHVLNITGMKELPPGSGKYELQIVNQWGEKYNGAVSLEDAYKLTLNPKNGNNSVPRRAFKPDAERKAVDPKAHFQRLFG